MRVLVATTVGRTVTAFLRPQLTELAVRNSVVVMCSATGELVGVPEGDVAIVEAPWTRPMPLRRLPEALRATRRTVREIDPDVVYLHTSIASGLVRVALVGLAGRPAVVYCAHGFDGADAQPWWRRTISRFVERVLSSVTDVVIVMNDEDEEWAHTLRRTEVVRMPSIGLDLAHWSRTTPEPDTSAPYRIVVVAELAPRKRVDLAIGALAALGDDFELVVLGDGPLRSELVAAANELDVARRVHFRGAVADPRSEIERAHVLLSCSRQEGLSRSVLEALSLGTPVVAVDARGVTDVLERGAGVVVPTGDAGPLAAAIERVCRDRELRAQLIDAGRSEVRRHDIAVLTPRYVDVVERSAR